MKIILIGIQGSGKSTQGNLLSKNLGVPYLSTGHIFREMAKEKTPLGRKVKEIMTAGLLQPDDLTVQVVETYLKKPEYAKGYIMDGFPRTLEQVEKFQNGVDKVICLGISDKEALLRLAYQNDGTRPDDSAEAIEKRIELFHLVTQPVIDHYKQKGMLVEVDGEQTIEEIHQQILKALGKN
ncbi:MAG TPA: nucleoside monophosphate kinase [Patescibacteria group bacterium]|jgi:adenylate kinase|nr:nucleoside monophosphate kinase [Patescibacteria group bacterium]